MGGGSSAPPVALIVIFPFFFVGLWLTVTYTLTRFSGWLVLQEAYPDRDDILRQRFRMRSAAMGGVYGMPVNYNRCLTIDACSSGIRFRVWPVFGMFQKPVLVPWSDISVSEKKVLFLRMARLKFARWPGGEMGMSLRQWNRIAAQSPVPGLALTC